jgi:hypothetical protein
LVAWRPVRLGDYLLPFGPSSVPFGVARSRQNGRTFFGNLLRCAVSRHSVDVLRQGHTAESTGQTVQRAAAVIVLLSAITLLFFYFVRRSWPEDIETGRFTAIAMGMTVLLAVFGFIRYCVIPRRRKDEVNSDCVA